MHFLSAVVRGFGVVLVAASIGGSLPAQGQASAVKPGDPCASDGSDWDGGGWSDSAPVARPSTGTASRGCAERVIRANDGSASAVKPTATMPSVAVGQAATPSNAPGSGVSSQLQFGGVGSAAASAGYARSEQDAASALRATEQAPVATGKPVPAPVGVSADAATFVDTSEVNLRFRPLPFDVAPTPPGYTPPDPLANRSDGSTRMWALIGLGLLLMIGLAYSFVVRAGNAAPVAQEFESRGGWRRRRRHLVGTEPVERLPRRAA